MKYKYSRKKIKEFIEGVRGEGYVLSTGETDELLDIILEPAEWPQEGDTWWRIHKNGEVVKGLWDGDLWDMEIKDFGNRFRTQKEAIKARDKIKKLLKGEK